MRFVDVNVLIYAHRPEAPGHERYHDWLQAALVADEPLGVADIVLTGFVRVATHPKVFKEPTPLETALEFAAGVRSAPAAVSVAPGPRAWPILDRIVRQTQVRGNDVHDAHLAAIALEHSATMVSADRGFARFKDLSWTHPLDTSRS